MLLLLAELATGFLGFLTGSPRGRWVFWMHSVGGLTLVALLFWKWRIVARSFVRRKLGLWAIPPTVLALLFLGSLGTGLLWSTVGLPRISFPGMGSWRGLGLHIGLSSVLVPLFLLHVIMRWQRPRPVDLVGRRAALRSLGVLAAGFVLWRGLESFSSLASLSGSDRRFTGSREEGSFAGNRHPLTNWLSDRTQRIDPSRWQLRVYGEVEREASLSYDDVIALGEEVKRAVLDCTGGWYTVQDWSGLPVDTLLQRTGVRDGARSLVFHSATGYDRRFRLGEAEKLLLATHVGGETLSPGHGFPLRLVAPDHRGYNWVKWVVAVEVSGAHPLWQPPLPLQ